MWEKMKGWLQNLAVVADLFIVAYEKIKGLVLGLPVTVKDYLKKTRILWMVIVAALVFYGDYSQFAVLLFLAAPVAAVLLIADLVFDSRRGWGLFPGLDLDAIIKEAISTPLSCALIFLGLCGLMIAVLVCTALVIS